MSASLPQPGRSMTTLCVFTRNLRVRDNPALAAAAAGPVLPLFVVDDALVRGAAPNRLAFLCDALADVDESLQRRGAALIVRRGDWVTEVSAAAREFEASAIHVVEDITQTARRRIRRLREITPVPVIEHPGVMVVPARTITAASGQGFKIFTPYYRRWSAEPWRQPLRSPSTIHLATGIIGPPLPSLRDLTSAPVAPGLATGGEGAGLARLKDWTANHLEHSAAVRDDLAGDLTSRISPHLHFGCLSPLEVASRLRGRPGAAPFVRQICWRDFFHQVLAARPDASHRDYRTRGDDWSNDSEGFAAWCAGRTGYPAVDAGMRQLLAEGFMHNRARMVVASFLTKDLYVDWRLGASHFMAHLVDGDIACNQLNWQWIAGTGTDTNRYRIFNPTRQSERFDPTGAYLRRWIPELADVALADIHQPSQEIRRSTGYPDAIVDHREAISEYRAR